MTTDNASRLPDDLFRLFSGIVRDRSGIEFTASNRFLLESRIAARIAEMRLDGARTYLHRLRYAGTEDSEVDALIDRVTNPESYFFREADQLAAFTDEVVPAWERESAAGSTLKIWSAGCAGGEEPYTLAMLLEERKFFDRHSVDIFGSDISPASLTRARTASYRENSFRQTSEERRSRFFSNEGPGRARLSEDIRRRVAFGRANLIDAARLATLPLFHVIFCRNVLIYLSEPAKRNVVTSLHGRLVPGGYLFLGRAESLVALSTEFHLRHLEHDMVYQK